jgi:hypothetical protein
MGPGVLVRRRRSLLGRLDWRHHSANRGRAREHADQVQAGHIFFAPLFGDRQRFHHVRPWPLSTATPAPQTGPNIPFLGQPLVSGVTAVSTSEHKRIERRSSFAYNENVLCGVYSLWEGVGVQGFRCSDTAAMSLQQCAHAAMFGKPACCKDRHRCAPS